MFLRAFFLFAFIKNVVYHPVHITTVFLHIFEMNVKVHVVYMMSSNKD